MGSAPPGGRRAPPSSALPRSATLQEGAAGAPAMRPRSAMPACMPASASQPHMVRAHACAHDRGFAQPAPMPPGRAAGAGGEMTDPRGGRVGGAGQDAGLLVRNLHGEPRGS